MPEGKRYVSCRAASGDGFSVRHVPSLLSFCRSLIPAPVQAAMSFVVNRAQAAEPNTMAYRPCSSRFLTISSQ